LPAKQHAPKARPHPPPTVAGEAWSRPAVKDEWLRRGELRSGGVPDIRP
jgi:hypothetical protein